MLTAIVILCGSLSRNLYTAFAVTVTPIRRVANLA